MREVNRSVLRGALQVKTLICPLWLSKVCVVMLHLTTHPPNHHQSISIVREIRQECRHIGL